MAQWEIRLANQPPVKVEVEEGRNLAAEYWAFQAEHDAWPEPTWWDRLKFWRSTEESPSEYWQITDTVILHKDIVAGVMPKKPKPPKHAIGFTPGTHRS
jgi:hypothetical protein